LQIILLGLPGAGKGTQAARLSSATGLAHITTGEIFRENIRAGTELGKKAQPFVEQGKLVPDEITIGMLLDRTQQADAAGGFMLDGFPRNMEQAEALDGALEAENRCIDRVIYIKVSTAELVRRLTGRWSCPQCGAVYHETNQPPRKAGVCDNCGSRLYQREDDKPEVVMRRFENYERETVPVVNLFRKEHKDVCWEVSAEASPGEVLNCVQHSLWLRVES